MQTSTHHTIVDAFAIQARVIRALVARELLTRYGRNNIGFLWVFVEPMIFALAIAWLWSTLKATSMPGVSIVAFAITGYTSVLLWRNAATRCTQAINTNWALMYHRNVTPLDMYLARIIIEIGAATMALGVMAAGFIAAGQMELPRDPLGASFAWVLLSGFALGFALVVGALATLSEAFERIWHLLTYLLFPVSGAMFMAAWLPEPMREVVLALPMVHGVEMLRGAWFGDAVQTYEDPAYLITSIGILIAIGLWLIRIAGRRVEPN